MGVILINDDRKTIQSEGSTMSGASREDALKVIESEGSQLYRAGLTTESDDGFVSKFTFSAPSKKFDFHTRTRDGTTFALHKPEEIEAGMNTAIAEILSKEPYLEVGNVDAPSRNSVTSLYRTEGQTTEAGLSSLGGRGLRGPSETRSIPFRHADGTISYLTGTGPRWD